MRKILPILLSIALFLAACQTGPTAAPPTLQPGPGGYTPKFEKADCPFNIPQGVTVECGYLVVPENRANPTGPTVRLAVGRFKATAANPAPDPILYLEGGPGGSPLRAYTKNFDIYFGAYAQKRDVILLDQRGTGYSTPVLDCPETTQASLDQLDKQLTPAEADKQYNQALAVCHDRLTTQGVDLGAYNSAESAADINDLRLTLGIKEWNLYGISYGTRLALEVLRDVKQGIRSVVIDSVYPPQASLVTDTPADFARALNLILDTCAADPSCNEAYPNLKQVLFDTAHKLNASPAKITLTQPDLGNIGTPGKQLPALLDGDSLLAFFFQVMYGSELIPSVPALIYQAKDSDLAAISQLQSQFLSQYKDISQGMYFSVECVEAVPFDTLAQAEAAYQAQPDLAAALGSPQGTFDACKIWNVPKAPAVEDQAVSSDVPTLVLSGQFDPITPPAWGKLAASTLSKSFFYEVPGAGHGSSLSVACPQKIALAFFDQPTSAPDTTCLSQTKFSFSVPVASMDVKLGPFDGGLMGFSGLVPANWVQTANVAGFYTPDGSATNPTQLLLQGAPVAADQFLSLMRTQLESSGITLDPSTQTFNIQSAGGLNWSFYEANGGLIKIDMGLASSGKSTFLVLLQSPWNERQALLQAVFIPVVESIIGK
jgi:pimeloyl-ACP methyl ester carboxylesterase